MLVPYVVLACIFICVSVEIPWSVKPFVLSGVHAMHEGLAGTLCYCIRRGTIERGVNALADMLASWCCAIVLGGASCSFCI